MFQTRLFILFVFRIWTALLPAQVNNNISALGAEQILLTRGEVILRFVKPPQCNINELSAFLSIDGFRNDTVVAYANKEAFTKFLELNIPFEMLPPPSLKKSPFADKKALAFAVQYPSYSDYLDTMQYFASAFPQLCRLEEFGVSVNSHKLLALKISDNPQIEENEPVVFYTAAIHGDEPLGYVMMLKLIDYLLARYPDDASVKNLIDNEEIWINPLSNPDGMYYVSDASIEGAKRFNDNQIDLNRNFPDIRSPNSENTQREAETTAMMNFMEEIRPVLAANFHSGAEVVNYPWDTWERLHADDSWYRHICRAYADTVHACAPASYMTYLDNGITNGYAWYSVYGGRQDYINYLLHGREVTIELSAEKIPEESLLNNYWTYNKKSLLQFLNNALTGISGKVSDSLTGAPLQASIFLDNYDRDNSFVISDKEQGSFYRLLEEGSYSASIEADGYIKRTRITEVGQNSLTSLDVKLLPVPGRNIFPNPFTDRFQIYISDPGSELYLTFIDLSGRKVKQLVRQVISAGMQDVYINDLAPGLYILQVSCNNKSWNIYTLKKGP